MLQMKIEVEVNKMILRSFCASPSDGDTVLTAGATMMSNEYQSCHESTPSTAITAEKTQKRSACIHLVRQKRDHRGKNTKSLTRNLFPSHCSKVSVFKILFDAFVTPDFGLCYYSAASQKNQGMSMYIIRNSCRSTNWNLLITLYRVHNHSKPSRYKYHQYRRCFFLKCKLCYDGDCYQCGKYNNALEIHR